MLWFKDKQKIEDFIQNVLENALPRGVKFFEKENERAHRPLTIPNDKLMEIGAGMCLFFLGEYYPDDKKKDNLEMMSRAFKVMEKKLPAMNLNPSNAYNWWKAFTDGLIFQENEDRNRIAGRIVWEKLVPNIPYREPSPLKGFGYFLQMEIENASKVKLV